MLLGHTCQSSLHWAQRFFVNQRLIGLSVSAQLRVEWGSPCLLALRRIPIQEQFRAGTVSSWALGMRVLSPLPFRCLVPNPGFMGPSLGTVAQLQVVCGEEATAGPSVLGTGAGVAFLETSPCSRGSGPSSIEGPGHQVVSLTHHHLEHSVLTCLPSVFQKSA